MEEYIPHDFKENYRLSELSETLAKDHSFLPVLAQAIIQLRADDDEIFNQIFS